MKRLPCILTLTACVFAASGAERVVDLSDLAIGRSPDGLTALTGGEGKPGVWKIVTDAVPSAFPSFTPGARKNATQKVIAQTDTELESGRVPMLLFDEEAFADFTCTVRLKIVDGLLRQQAGLTFRAQDKDNYYVTRIDGMAKKLSFAKMYQGRPAGPPIEVDAPVAKGKWHTLRVNCRGNSINIFLDDQQPIPTLTDNTFKIGAAGLWTLGDTVARFADLKLDFKRHVRLAQKLVDDLLKEYPRLRGVQIYTLLPDKPGIHLVASSDPSEVGQLGGKTEEEVIQTGGTAYGVQKRERQTTVVVPLRDRNGDPVAAVRFRMKRALGETRRTSVAKTQPMIRAMQRRVLSVNDLVE